MELLQLQLLLHQQLLMLDMLALLLMLFPQVLLVWYLTQMEQLLQQIPHLLLLPELNTWLPEMLLML
jgi:hypothetical protein